MQKQTVMLLNLRFSDFYSDDLFKKIKEKYPLRLVAVLDQHFKNRIGQHILPYLDEIYTLDANAKDGFLAEFDFYKLSEIAQKELSKTDNLRIVCTDEFNLLNAGRLRRHFSLEGNTDFDMIPFRDKTKMKHLLQNAGIRVPRFKILESDDNFPSLSQSIGLPFVIKPIDSCGSFGVYIIYDMHQFDEVLNQINKSDAQFEVEEYIEGKLYHVDSCIQNNEFNFICANEYSFPNHDYTKGKALSSIPLDNNKLGISLVHFAKRALLELGSNNLINHMEIFVTNNQELVFLEVSARPPGGLLNFTHRINHGINLMDLDFFMQSGLSVDLHSTDKIENVFSVIFPYIPGKIIKFNVPKVQSRIEITYFKSPGDVIYSSDCNSIVGKIAHALLYHQDECILRQDFEYMRNFNLAEMELI